MPHDAYVRIPSDGLARIRPLSGGRRIQVEQGKPFCRVEWDDFETPEAWLRETSRGLATDVLWLVFQKQSDAFAFEHWTNGESGRRLAYGLENERVWERVDGSPEEWEAEAFFSARALERRIRVIGVIDMPTEAREQTAGDLERIWMERRIDVGAAEPLVAAGSAGAVVARFYDLPSWQ